MSVRSPAFVLGSSLLLLAACANEPRRTSAPAAAPVVPAVAAPERQSAVEAALARSGSVAAADGTLAPGATEAPALREDAPQRYVVKRGDTLWDISALYLQSPWRWPDLWRANPSIQNPHLIYPGDTLLLVAGADGTQRLELQRAGGTNGSGLAATGGAPGDVVKVTPLLRSEPLQTPIAALPAATIASFLGKPQLLSRDQVRQAPYIAGLSDGHAAAGAPQTVHVRGLRGASTGSYHVMHLGDPVKDPATGKPLGHLAVYAGTVQITAGGRVATGKLVESTRETLVGDLLFPVEADVGADLQPRPAPATVQGQIAAVVDAVTLIGQYQVVALNRGREDGLEPGHVLAIQGKPDRLRDTSCSRRLGRLCGPGATLRLPGEQVGTVLVFRSDARMSFGLTVNVTAPVRIGDQVAAP